jgi:hypothetical protein
MDNVFFRVKEKYHYQQVKEAGAEPCFQSFIIANPVTAQTMEARLSTSKITHKTEI